MSNAPRGSQPDKSNITTYSKPPWVAVMSCQTAKSFVDLATGYLQADERLSSLNLAGSGPPTLALPADPPDRSLSARLAALRKNWMGE